MGICGSSQHTGGPKDQHDHAKIEQYLRAHTSLPHVLSSEELKLFAQHFAIIDFLPGVSICADGDVGRDFYVLAEGAISMFIEEDLFCAKNPGDYICMGAKYPPPPVPLTTGRVTASSIDEGHMMVRSSSTRSSSASISDKPGFGKCLAVSTANTRLIQLTREKWMEFQKAHVGDGICDRIYPLLVEPSESLSKINFFKGINARMLQNIGLMFRTVYLKKDEILFEELSEGHSLFIVSSGTAIAYVKQEDGSEKLLKTFKTQDILGEIALIMNVPRTATVKATSNCFLLELHRENFKRFVKMVPSTGNIHSIMKSRTAEHFRKYKVPFFNSIPEDKYIILAELCKIEQFPAGQVVFHEGDPANCFYIVAHGDLKVTVKNKPTSRMSTVTPPTTNKDNEVPAFNKSSTVPMPTKRSSIAEQPSSLATNVAFDPITGEREITRLGPGNYFGEISLVQDAPRTATVTALTRTIVLSITKENFQLFFEQAPEAIADFEVKLARYDVRLRSVLYHPVGLQFFIEHLKREWSVENIEFWKECRDFRHLTFADVPQDEAEEARKESELQKEIEAEIKLMASLTGSSAGGKDALTSPRARRQSLVRIQGLDIAAAFDLFVDATVKPANAQVGEEFLSIASLTEMFRFFQIPLPDDDMSVMMEMANQLGYDADSHPYINRTDFIRVLVDIQNGKFVETTKRRNLDVQLGRLSVQLNQAAVRSVTTGLDISDDPTTDYIPAAPTTAMAGTASTVAATSAAAEALSPTSSASQAHGLSLASKLLVKLTKIILDLRIAKLKSTFDLYDIDHSGTIELNEFQNVCTVLNIETNVAKVSQAFRNVDVDGSGSISLLEFVAFIFVEKKQEKALQALLERRAKQIYDTYISNRAPKQVNIRGPAQKRLKDILEGNTDASPAGPVAASSAPTPVPIDLTAAKKGDSADLTAASTTLPPGVAASPPVSPLSRPHAITQHIFDEAEEEIMKLMSADSFSRFKQSELFQQFLIAAGAYNFRGPAGQDDNKVSVPENKLKIRSGSVKFPSSGGGVIETLAAVATRESVDQPQTFLMRTATGGLLTEESKELDSDQEDFSPPPPPIRLDDIEQIGVEILTSTPVALNSSQPRTKHRASLVLPPRPIVGRPTTRSVFYRSEKVPVGVNTLRLNSEHEMRGPLTASFFDAIEERDEETQHTRSQSAAVPASPPKKERTVTASEAPASTTSQPTTNGTTTSNDSHAPIPTVHQPRDGSLDSHSPPPLDTTTEDSGTIRPVTDADSSPTNGDLLSTPARGSHMHKNILQSPTPPPNLPDLDKNPLQSPLAVRRGSGHHHFNISPVRPTDVIADPTLPPPPESSFNEADTFKNPLQSPAVNRRRSSNDDSVLKNL